MTRQIFFTALIALLIGLLCAVVFLVNLNKNNTMQLKSGIKLTSQAFENNQQIPVQYSGKGENINPPLSIDSVPEGTKSLALIVDDPDAPSGDWVHWLVWNIPAETLSIDKGSIPVGSVQGLNDSKHNNYDGPCPPSGTHRYFFKLYALDVILNLDKNSRKNDLENTTKGHILDQTSLVGLFSK